MNSSNNTQPISPDRLAEDFFSMEETAIAEVLADYTTGILSEDEACEAKELIENHPIAIGLWKQMEANHREDETPEGKAHLDTITQSVLARLEDFKKSQPTPALVALPTAAQSSATPTITHKLKSWFTGNSRNSTTRLAAQKMENFPETVNHPTGGFSTKLWKDEGVWKLMVVTGQMEIQKVTLDFGDQNLEVALKSQASSRVALIEIGTEPPAQGHPNITSFS
jgi:hypothetical protein